jgi:hypothetical protein
VAKTMTVERLKALVADMLNECPDLARLDAPQVAVMTVTDATQHIATLEKALEEAGGIGADLAASFMMAAAVATVLESFPAEDDRRRLSMAGRAIGKVVVEQWRSKVGEALAKLKN